VDLLTGRGYEVVAVSGKKEADEHLKALGASRILRRQDIDLGKRPLEAAQWGGAIDNVGGEILTWLTRTVDNWGNIVSIGLAASHKLETTVMPFILRGVSLLGVNSSSMPRDVRLAIWKRLATDLRPRHPDRLVTRTIGFDELPGAFDDYIKGRVMGRTVVKIA
jgi:NADPH2:quinone reductase